MALIASCVLIVIIMALIATCVLIVIIMALIASCVLSELVSPGRSKSQGQALRKS